ncbi:MAG: polysaccharide pyruvyl transferase CsaB [Pseudanabaenaceae cyanobacterium SKYGB_i_bin29]|nr:polysaccharide pyruvyl transferase CsaB [Pseudanabaenaceae cyanobacterium SKYG29]MDW8422593.1 polysaccharide pyruvyl transferase CsaB [Pseudanabaenaceae cyanobacterium SKYGB_i_bin29]
MTRAVICGYYGRGNGGDEALLATLLQLLPAHVEPIVLTAAPLATAKLHQVEAIDCYNWGLIFQTLKRSDVFIWGGGSLLQDVSSWRSPFYYGGLLWLAKKLGLTTIAWAQGLGPLKHSLTRWFTQQVFPAIDRISVRDNLSAELLRSWGYEVLVAPDPVWALDIDRSAAIWQLPAPRVAVVVRPHRDLNQQRLAILKTALTYFQQATDTHILLVPFQPSQDRAIAEFLHIPQSTILTVAKPQSLKGLFAGVEMTIGMRFHSLIMALSQANRCWAIDYDPKVRQLMQEFGLPGCPVAAITDPQYLCQAWLEHFANGEALSPTQIAAVSDRALIHSHLLEGL